MLIKNAIKHLFLQLKNTTEGMKNSDNIHNTMRKYVFRHILQRRINHETKFQL